MSDPREQDDLRAAGEEALTHGYALPGVELAAELAAVKELAWRRVLQLDAMEKHREDLRELLRIEFLRNNHFDGPWKCVESDCPYFGKPVSVSGCNCYLEFKRKHIAAVKKELGL